MKGAIIASAAVTLVVGAMVWSVLRFSGGHSLRYEEMDGAAIYDRLCSQCHGPDGRAVGRAGASYRDKRQYWTEESLLDYLADPAAFQRNDSRLRGRYMPPIDGTMPRDARLRLARHVLGVMDGLEGSSR
ncbi:MAG: cytochrome c [Planctomycetota bacterium]|nr:cytochrome c [Planctomycetota bacterium]MEC8510731.1 cytochrome c [Planctomycetota bacterium]